MRVLVIGSGGREHALAWRLRSDPEVSAVLCAPGNPGTAEVAENVAVAETDASGLAQAVRGRDVDLVVVGPEAPLAAGVADRLREAGANVLGPSAAAAALEASKAFAKDLMAEAGVPTAAFEVCDDEAQAHAAAERMGAPIVVKADGLAAGKGVTVAMDLASAHRAIEEAMAERRFGTAGERLVLEAYLPGPEASAFALSDGERFAVWPLARDHKRLLAGDEGPNTGGMGAVTPLADLGVVAGEVVAERVFSPVLRAMARRGAPFQGVLYAGLKWGPAGPQVLEFNVRLGDPEAQALVMTMQGSPARAFLAAASGRLDEAALKFAGAGAAEVAAAAGYPQAPKLGAAIDLGRAAEAGSVIFHAGTRRTERGLVVGGGRVLCAAAQGGDLTEARARAYRRLARVSFAGMQARADIGM